MPAPRTHKCLLVYGGSFDPPHRAHVELPWMACKAVGAEGVLYVPAGLPPHKPNQPVTPAHHRLAMLKLALSERTAATISTYELDNPGPSFTVNTLEHLRRTLGADVRLRLLIGADMAACFTQWREPDRIVELAEPLVMLREPFDEAQWVAKLGGGWAPRFVRLPFVSISSTELRGLLAQRRYEDPVVRANLHPHVTRYIRQNNLYV